MTSWIFGFSAALLIFAAWYILRARRARQQRQALLQRDRTGRATLGRFSSFGSVAPGPESLRPTILDRDRPARASIDHASTLPVSFNNSGGWLTNDSCMPANPDTSNDSCAASSTH